MQSKRASQIIVKADESDLEPVNLRDRAVSGLEVIKGAREQFDLSSTEVGLRDSTWLLGMALAVAVVILTWNHPQGLDLVARVLVIGGCATIGVTIMCRKKLTD
jgi:hypothetical protein